MTTSGITPDALRDQLDDAEVDFSTGGSTGYAALNNALNLNAIAIGLGLENIVYDPEQFPGLIYHVDRPQVTLVLFGNGVITAVNGDTDQEVRDAIATAVERGAELGLIEDDSVPDVNVDAETFPIPDEIEVGE